MTAQPGRPSSGAGARAVLAAIACGLTALGIALATLQPWQPSRRPRDVATFRLDRDVSVQIDLPRHWVVRPASYEGTPFLLVLPESDRRPTDRVHTLLAATQAGLVFESLHLVLVHTASCRGAPATADPGEWVTLGTLVLDQPGPGPGAQVRRRPAYLRLDSDVCVFLIGLDAQSVDGRARTDGTDVARRLVAHRRVTASRAA